MSQTKNILFVMCDQLRADYLGCYGHPTIKTPNIDALAKRGILFTRAYCQAPICGPSRMSFYTGRYVTSHGSTFNGFPLRVDEVTLGDYMRDLDVYTALIGKTHMRADLDGLSRMGIDPYSVEAVLLSECGFDPVLRHDGLYPYDDQDFFAPYNEYLREQGYLAPNPWLDYANSAEGEDGEILSGWQMRHANLPARIKKEHSETAFITDRALEFFQENQERAWCLHLSYIKPHWPYMAPDPYHALYSEDEVLKSNRDDKELENPHPVYAAFLNHEDSKSFQRDEVRQRVIPTYMGLIKEIDDHFGRLMTCLDDLGLMDETMIVFTSDHGDFLGDHWLGEKELFFEEAVRIPLIISDPHADAEASRGSEIDRLVESIDLIPTFIDALGGEAQPHRLEGRSLRPLLRGKKPDHWRHFVVSELDYFWRQARLDLGKSVNACRVFMIRNDRWKYIYYEGFRPQLFDLKSDPNELCDLGDSASQSKTRKRLESALFDWLRHRRSRVTVRDGDLEPSNGDADVVEKSIGKW